MRKVLSLVMIAAMIMMSVVFFPQKSLAVPSGFVYRNGTNFYLDGAKFYYAGSNRYQLGLSNSTYVDDNVAGAVGIGIKVIRIWAFNNGNANGIQPTLGTYNETALRQLDYAVKRCKDYGIKVILPFVNYWTGYGGMQWYVDQRLGTGQSIDKFYTDASVKQDYKNYVNMLINRTNYYTGVKYKDEPAVFCWELANEPSCNSDTTGNTFYNWMNEMAGYIKGLDSNHMLSIGDQGFKTGGTQWGDNGSAGTDYVRNIQNSNIDFATVHFYPVDWGKDSAWQDYYLSDRASIAHNTAGKPIVLEEYGVSLQKVTDRDPYISSWQSIGTRAGNDYNGFNVWSCATTGDTGFCFAYSSSTGQLIQDLVNIQAGKSSQGTSAISNLSVKDSTNAVDWSIQSNIQSGNTQYGDRGYKFTTVPSIVAGGDWIRTANDSKAYTGNPLVTFTVTRNTTVYVAFCDSISPKPSWLDSSWVDSGTNIVNDESTPRTFSVYQKSYTANSTVSLGPNGNTTYSLYTVIVK